MHYSISSSKTDKFTFGNELENSYIDWLVSEPLDSFFNTYKETYKAKNNVIIFDVSYFDVLCELFVNENFSIKKLRLNSVIELLKEKVFENRISYYEENHKIIEYAEDAGEERLSIEEVEELNDNYIDKYHLMAKKDQEIVELYKQEIIEKNYIILNEFKEFIMGFENYMIQSNQKEYNNFKTYFNILKKDMIFFKKTQINTLSKYRFEIGGSTKTIYSDNKKINSFIAAGICRYWEKIFINSELINKKYGVVWFNRQAKHVFYHEIGHALDNLLFNDKVLKKINSEKSSYTEDFKNMCIKNYYKFRILKYHIYKKYTKGFNYYISPKIHERIIYNNKKIIDTFSEALNKDYDDIFKDIFPIKQNIYEEKIKKRFDTKIIRQNKILDFSSPLCESWAEDFAFVFSWIKNGFSEYDKFAMEAKSSKNRFFIKIQYDCMIYILENFDWTKLNISYNVYLKRKVQIKKYLKHIKDMPLITNKKVFRQIKSKKYISYNDLLKNR